MTVLTNDKCGHGRTLALLRAAAFLVVMPLALVGCTKQAESSVAAGVDFQVDKLFTTDGCTVYRFRDGGKRLYFTNCGGSTMWQDSHQCGKARCSDPAGVSGGVQ